MQTIRYDVIDSTSNEARRLLAAGRLEDVACVVAREQTGGRGTHDRAWVSPRDAGVYLTVVRRIDRSLTLDPRQITPALGMACARLLRDATGAPIALRGVNDLYARGRKLGGLLTEVLTSGDCVRAMLVGVGINVRAGAVRLPPAEPVAAIGLEELTASRTWSGEAVADLTSALATAVSASLAELLDEA